MPQEHFTTLTREHLDVDRIRVRQAHHEQRDLPSFAAHTHLGEAEIDLRFPRRMRQRQEHFLTADLQLPHRILHDGVTAREAVLVTQPLPDPLGRMSLLTRRRPVGVQHGSDDR